MNTFYKYDTLCPSLRLLPLIFMSYLKTCLKIHTHVRIINNLYIPISTSHLVRYLENGYHADNTNIFMFVSNVSHSDARQY